VSVLKVSPGGDNGKVVKLVAFNVTVVGKHGHFVDSKGLQAHSLGVLPNATILATCMRRQPVEVIVPPPVGVKCHLQHVVVKLDESS
jgi:hypothetical protein